MNIRKNSMNLLLVAEAGLLVLALVLGLIGGATGALRNPSGDGSIVDNGTENDWGYTPPSTDENSNSGNTDKPVNPDGPDDKPDDKPAVDWFVYNVTEEYSEARKDFSASVERKLATMTVEQKVAQLFVVSPEALTGYSKVTAFGNASKVAYDKHPVGGLVYSSKNFQNSAQVQLLLNGIRNYGLQKYGITVFTAVEEIGGANGSPLATALGINRVSTPSELGNQGLSAVEQAAKLKVGYLASNGFNLLLSTSGDVSPALDTAYRLLTYGTDGKLVASMVAADIKATEAAKVNAALQYFPGKANASEEGGILYNDMSIEELSQYILASYHEGIKAGASVVTVSNVIVPAITDDENMPCSLSSSTIGILREEMGFDGVIMTEKFSDPEFVSLYGNGSACINAIKAGVDMIYMPADFEEAYTAVLNAVKSGSISADRLNNAVGRILTEKGV